MNDGSNIGGLSGYHRGATDNCYSTMTVIGGSVVGGLIGTLNVGTLTNCFSIGEVSGTANVGGLVGSGTGTTTSCYWDNQKSKQSSSSTGVGKTTSEMKNLTTYVGYDFTTVWLIKPGYGYGYPVMSDNLPPLDLISVSNIILTPVIPPEIPRLQKIKWTPFKRR